MCTSRLDHLGVRPLVSVSLVLTVSVESVAVHKHTPDSETGAKHLPAAGNSTNPKPGPLGLTAVTVGVSACKGSR